MRPGVFEPNDTDHRNNSALFGGNVSDTCDTLVFSYVNQTISPEHTDSQSFWVFIVVVIPFLMLIYFGLAILISDTISVGGDWLTADDKELTFSEGFLCRVIGVAMVALAQFDSAG